MYTPLLTCRGQCQRRPLSLSLNFHAERSSPETAGDFNISNYTILKTFKLQAERIWLLAACPNVLNPLNVMISTLTKHHSKTWTRFPTSSTLKTSQTWSLNHRHLWHGWKYTPAPALRLSITLLSHGNAIFRVAVKQTYKTISTTRCWCVKSTTLCSVGLRRRAWRHTMTTGWRKKTQLCVSESSKMWIASRSSWLACQMIMLSGSGNYTLLRIWDGITITNAQSNTGVETLSNSWDGWCGSQPKPGISFTPLSIGLTMICPQTTSIPKCTLRTGGGRHR